MRMALVGTWRAAVLCIAAARLSRIYCLRHGRMYVRPMSSEDITVKLTAIFGQIIRYISWT